MEERRRVLFEKYELQRLIGRGHFGKVCLYKNTITGQNVAIKEINKDMVKQEGMMEQTKREISVMRLVRHPNIVDLKEVMATKTKIYLVMEYVSGGDLYTLLEKGKLNEDSARRYFQQLITAVDYCHSRGVCHRDIKLDNVLLDENGDVKVADFGFSALIMQRRGGYGSRHSSCRGTNAGRLLYTLCGTPAYSAPEVLKGDGYDGVKADIWSCGVILFSLICGYLPFQDRNLIRMYGQIFAGRPNFPDWFPLEARRLLSMIFEGQPEKRIAIPMIKQDSWFLQNLKHLQPFSALHPNSNIMGVSDHHLDNHDQVVPTDDDPHPLPSPLSSDECSSCFQYTSSASQSPTFFNAFELITSMSSGFDLSNIFENERRSGQMFLSRCPATQIMAGIESVAMNLNYRVARLKGFKLKLFGSSEGLAGLLVVTAEVFNIADGLAVVEFSKSAGDSLEYINFCQEQVRPALGDIVWNWQGEYAA